MSFKWKWLITTFMTQILFGLLFCAIQFYHMTHNARIQLENNFESIRLNVSGAQGKSRDTALDALKFTAREAFLKHELAAITVLDKNIPVYSLGQRSTDSSAFSMNIDFDRLFPVAGSDWVVYAAFKPSVVFEQRNNLILYLISVFLLSSVACSAVLLSLGNALSNRLDQLRHKAIAIQSGASDVRIDESGDDEISCLGQAFNNMADAIEQQIKLMEESNLASRSEKNRLDLLLSSLNSGVAYLDEHFNVLYVNKALARMLKTSFPKPESPDLAELLKSAGVVKEQRAVLKDLMTEYFRNHELPVELDLEDGRALQLRFALYRDKTQGPHGVLIVEDVSMKKSVEDLKIEVETDPLTAVLNRRGFEMTLKSRLSRMLPGELLGVMYLDLDGFKAVNDTLGHKAGDQILKTTASLLKGATRNIDLVARLGGDEFAIIVGRASVQLMSNISDRIIESFARDKLLTRIRQNHHLNVTCSIGAALYPLHASTSAELLELSDKQMYYAKKSGKNCFKIASNDQQNLDNSSAELSKA